MASTQTLLIFDLDEVRFGVDATVVRESLWLPELTPLQEAPPHVVGIFNLRGQIVPVTDLNLRFNHPARPYRTIDQVVILEVDQLQMGLIVSEVIDVITVEGSTIQLRNAECGMRNEERGAGNSTFEMVQVGDNLVTVLDANQLVHQTQISCSTRELAGGRAEPLTPAAHFCPQATAEEHAIFRARAKALMESSAEEGGVNLPLAVVVLGDEYFGIDLHSIQEVCVIGSYYQIPCCPQHILGAISLRGNLLTLLDLRTALNLPRVPQKGGKAVITRIGEQAVGVAVDEVHDVIYLREEELQTAPPVLREQHGAKFKCTTSYGGRMMAVLDLPALLAQEEWIVNEQC